MASRSLAALQERWEETGSREDEQAFIRGLVTEKRLPPDEQIGLSFVDAGLEFSAPGITSLVQSECRAGISECGYWEDVYQHSYDAWLFRVGLALVVRLHRLETKNYHHDDLEVTHFVSHDQGRTWQEAQLRFYRAGRRVYSAEERRVLSFCWSDDRGRTRKGGVTYCWSAGKGGREQSISYTGGCTWSDVSPDEFADEEDSWVRYLRHSPEADPADPRAAIERGGKLFHPRCLEGRKVLTRVTLT